MESDLNEFAVIASAYQGALGQAKLHLGQLGYSATTRVKTTGTLIDKLRRESTRLSQVQDLAGARIVVGNRAEQNDAVNEISTTFDRLEGGRCKVMDRRENPSYGYRAVHIIVRLEGVPIEIQVRTDLQDMWAQITEKLADRWGRGIRYGEDPEDPDAEVQVSGFKTRNRRQAIDTLGALSYAVSHAEEAQLHSIKAQRRMDQVIQELRDMEQSGSSRPLLDEDLPPDIARAVIDAVRKFLEGFPQGRALDLPQSMTLNEMLEVGRSMIEVSGRLFSRQARYELQRISQLTDG